MLASVKSAIADGWDVQPVTVELELSRTGLPRIGLIGSPRQSVSESRERVQAALRSVGIELPRARVLINLVPIDVPKTGSALDLAVVAALLQAHRLVPIGKWNALGEVGIDGSVRTPSGLSALLSSYSGEDVVLVPAVSLPLESEAKLWPVSTIADLLPIMRGQCCRVESNLVYPMRPVQDQECLPESITIDRQLIDMVILALAGQHHTLLYGEPGVGKTFVADLISFLQPPEPDGLARLRRQRMSLIAAQWQMAYAQRVIRPHHAITVPALVGGGGSLQPGLVSLADGGVLFLDELPEFSHKVLESLRQPLEQETITVARLQGAREFPCRFVLIATANPCPCGYAGTPRCRCHLTAIEQYKKRLSGALLDRIDLTYRVRNKTLEMVKRDFFISARQRIQLAHEKQAKRQLEFGVSSHNRRYQLSDFERIGWSDQCALVTEKNSSLTPRQRLRLLRLARTITDCQKRENVNAALKVAQDLISGQEWLIMD